MKVSKKVLSIPPYVSTSWKNIVSLRLETDGFASPRLLIQLTDGAIVKVPELDPMFIDQIFQAHAQYLESPPEMEMIRHLPNPVASLMSSIAPGEQVIGVPLKFGPGGLESVGSMLQHDPAQADAPDLPPEILQKITGISQVLGVENVTSLPHPEPGCNCFHCQIARAMGRATEATLEIDEPTVSDDELKFRSWDITQVGENLYTVANPLDVAEQYSVFLGEPLGCTCGHKNCEHIHAVLTT